MDFISGGGDGQAGGAVAEGIDVDAAALGGDVGPVVGGLEEVDEFARPGAQGVTGDIGTSGGQVLVEAGRCSRATVWQRSAAVIMWARVNSLERARAVKRGSPWMRVTAWVRWR